jgi:hypothetical protein
MKENFSGQRFESGGEHFLPVEAFLSEFSGDFLQTGFLEWERRLQACCESGGEPVEYTVQNCLVTLPITRAGDESPGQYRTPCMFNKT